MAKKAVEKKAPSCTFEQLAALGVQNLSVGDKVIGQVVPRRFATGSYGLGFNSKALVQLPDGSVAQLQVSCNMTVVNSGPPKKAKEEASEAA